MSTPECMKKYFTFFKSNAPLPKPYEAAIAERIASGLNPLPLKSAKLRFNRKNVVEHLTHPSLKNRFAKVAARLKECRIPVTLIEDTPSTEVVSDVNPEIPSTTATLIEDTPSTEVVSDVNPEIPSTTAPKVDTPPALTDQTKLEVLARKRKPKTDPYLVVRTSDKNQAVWFDALKELADVTAADGNKIEAVGLSVNDLPEDVEIRYTFKNEGKAELLDYRGILTDSLSIARKAIAKGLPVAVTVQDLDQGFGDFICKIDELPTAPVASKKVREEFING